VVYESFGRLQDYKSVFVQRMNIPAFFGRQRREFRFINSHFEFPAQDNLAGFERPPRE
jgi:hypothetical protein